MATYIIPYSTAQQPVEEVCDERLSRRTPMDSIGTRRRPSDAPNAVAHFGNREVENDLGFSVPLPAARRERSTPARCARCSATILAHGGPIRADPGPPERTGTAIRHRVTPRSAADRAGFGRIAGGRADLWRAWRSMPPSRFAHG